MPCRKRNMKKSQILVTNFLLITICSAGTGSAPGQSGQKPRDITLQRMSCGESLFVTSTTVIRSPQNSGTSHYPNQVDCIWTASVLPSKLLKLTFSAFDLEYCSTCCFDYVEVRDGNSSASPLIAKFCGSDIPKELTSTGRVLRIRFRSDDTVAKTGFVAQITVVDPVGVVDGRCGENFNANSGTIESPNYPNKYHNAIDCFWRIRTEIGSNVVLTFQDFNVEYEETCGYDYLEVRDGIGSSSQSLGKFCGNELPTTLTATGNALWIKFHTDHYVRGTGFRASFSAALSTTSTTTTTTTLEPCGGILTSKTGYFQSPNYPDHYNNNQDCQWTISAPHASVITLEFLDFNLENCEDDCCYDNVQVFDGPSSQSTLMGKFCGRQIPERQTSSGNHLTFLFHTDPFVVGNGFLVRFSAQKSRELMTILGQHFLLSRIAMTQQEAADECQRHGYKLFEPDNQDINDAVNEAFVELFPVADSYWIGIVNAREPERYTTLTFPQQGIGFSKWQNDNPNGQHCVQVSTLDRNIGRWSGVSCHFLKGFVCEQACGAGFPETTIGITSSPTDGSTLSTKPPGTMSTTERTTTSSMSSNKPTDSPSKPTSTPGTASTTKVSNKPPGSTESSSSSTTSTTSKPSTSSNSASTTGSEKPSVTSAIPPGTTTKPTDSTLGSTQPSSSSSQKPDSSSSTTKKPVGPTSTPDSTLGGSTKPPIGGTTDGASSFGKTYQTASTASTEPTGSTMEFASTGPGLTESSTGSTDKI